MVKDKLAFEQKDRGYKVRAWYLKDKSAGDALIQIFFGRKKIKEFPYPAYKIWNIAAHFSDMVDNEITK